MITSNDRLWDVADDGEQVYGRLQTRRALKAHDNVADIHATVPERLKTFFTKEWLDWNIKYVFRLHYT